MVRRKIVPGPRGAVAKPRRVRPCSGGTITAAKSTRSLPLEKGETHRRREGVIAGLRRSALESVLRRRGESLLQVIKRHGQKCRHMSASQKLMFTPYRSPSVWLFF